MDKAAGEKESDEEFVQTNPRQKRGASKGTSAFRFVESVVKVLGPTTARSATLCASSAIVFSAASLELGEASAKGYGRKK